MRTRNCPLALSFLAVALVLPAAARAADPIGPENCKTCHPAAYEAWKDSQHSKGSSSLSAKQQKDARCLSCHSPDQAKGVPDVSCETCHGGGQFYSPRYVMKDQELSRAVGLLAPSEKMCLKCHDANAPSLAPFKFEEKLKLIDHWSAARAARKEKAAAASDKAKADKPKDKPKGKSSP
ncbi:MAG: cytochrome c3 family protein [Myxococcales bacterium]